MGPYLRQWPIIGVLLFAYSKQYVIGDSSSHNFCDGLSHGSYFEYACCNGTMLDVGIDFQANWKKCATREDTETTVHQTLWRLYKCIVETSTKRKTPSLSKFASTITENYPSTIKSKIMKVVKATKLDSSDLNTIRLTYHNIEKGVCYGNYKEQDISTLTTCKDIVRETDHFRGDCCNGEQVPIRLTYLRREPSEVSQDCTLKLAKKAGILVGASMINGQPVPIVKVQTYDTTTYYNRSDVRQLCLQTCIVKEDFKIEFDPFSSLPFDFEKFTKAVLHFFPETVQNKILANINNTVLQTEVEEFVFYNVDQLMNAEFKLPANRTAIKLLMNTCESHNLAVRTIELALLQICGRASGSEANPEPEPEAAQS